MFKYIKFVIFLCIFLLGAKYLLIENPPFPAPPPNALQSKEPADTESPLRRAYFTDYTRDQVIKHYKAQWEYMPIVNLNYPPEEAQLIIRDQTRSTYLEELVHPFRESIYINGFEPQKQNDDIWIDGKHFAQKIIIRLVPSYVYARLGIFILSLIAIYVLIVEWLNLAKRLVLEIRWVKLINFFIINKS